MARVDLVAILDRLYRLSGIKFHWRMHQAFEEVHQARHDEQKDIGNLAGKD